MHECQICKNYARRTLAEILRHIREVHPHFEGKVKCIVSGCPSTLSTYGSLHHHMYKKHKDVLKDDCSSDIPTTEDISSTSDDRAGMAELNVFTDSSIGVESSNGQSDPHYEYEAAKYILKIQEGRKLTQTVTEGIIKDTTLIVHHTIDHLKKMVYARLKDTVDINEAQLDDIEEILCLQQYVIHSNSYKQNTNKRAFFKNISTM